jgi:hypothetical protein
MCCAVACVMLAACQSVSEARQKSRRRSGTVSAVAIDSAVGLAVTGLQGARWHLCIHCLLQFLDGCFDVFVEAVCELDGLRSCIGFLVLRVPAELELAVGCLADGSLQSLEDRRRLRYRLAVLRHGKKVSEGRIMLIAWPKDNRNDGS